MKSSILILVLAVALTACGVKGDPEPPGGAPKTDQTQQNQSSQ